MQPAPDLSSQFKALKLYGMATSYREIVHDAVQKKLGAYDLIASLLNAEAAERQTRSIAYQMQAAKFPVFRDLDSFQFDQSSLNEGVIRELYAGGFIDETRNVVFVGGPGTGKTHLAISIAAAAIKRQARLVRFFNVTELTNHLEYQTLGSY